MSPHHRTSQPASAVIGHQEAETAAPPKFEFVANPMNGSAGNFVLRMPDFHISYAPQAGAGFSFCASDGGSETALVCRKGYLILNGDWRAEYAAVAAKGLDACLEVFRQHEATHRSSWSADELK